MSTKAPSRSRTTSTARKPKPSQPGPRKGTPTTLDIPATMVKWAQEESRHLGIPPTTFLLNLLKQKMKGVIVLEVDVTERPDGLVQIDVFPDKPGRTVVAKSYPAALEQLREEIEDRRFFWKEYRLNRRRLPAFNNVKFKRIEVEVACLPLSLVDQNFKRAKALEK